MFLGQYEHAIDEKSRITIPKRYREILQSGAYLTQGFDCNLMVLTNESFQKFYDRLNQISITDPISRQLRRMFFSQAAQVEIDGAGRLLLPGFLRDYAHLKESGIIVGNGPYFEIWATDEWLKQQEILHDVDANSAKFTALNLSLF